MGASLVVLVGCVTPRDRLGWPLHTEHSSGSVQGDSKGLDERERRLNEWEKNLQQREQALKDGEPVSNNNWPPCYPIIRSNIKEDFTDSFDEELKAQGWIVMWAYRLMLGEDL